MMNTLLLCDQISVPANPVTHIFVNFAASVHIYLDLKTVIGTSNVHSELDYYNSLFYEYEYDLTEYGNVFNSSKIL